MRCAARAIRAGTSCGDTTLATARFAASAPLRARDADAQAASSADASARISPARFAPARTSSAPISTAPISSAASAVAGGGRPLSAADRAFFEPRFGRDLSHVRLHADAAAGRAALGLGARAYSLENHIAFAPGEYAPSTLEGRRLIAHELAHTLQQGAANTIRRTCPTDPARIPPGGSVEFEQEVDAIVALDAYRGLNARARAIANHIIDGARGSACPMFYITELRALLDTPDNPPEQTAAELRQESVEAAEAERTRLQDPAGAALVGVEEAATASPARRWRSATGEGGTRYRIDDRDPANVYVHMRVRLRARGSGTAEDVARTASLEDAIETIAATRGYVLDIEFVRRGGRDVFDVGVDPSEWTTSRNWVGDAEGIAHEAHHLLGLEDRYDYLTHARNPDLGVEDRLYWFREQMVRAPDVMSEHSMMRDHSQGTLNEEDVCALTSGPYRDCLVARFALRPAREIEAIATDLSHPYRPQHAALLRVLTDAWERRPFAELTANCADGDPLCGLPPTSAFGDSNITAGDATRFPLANPHEQPEGRTLRRTRRTRR